MIAPKNSRFIRISKFAFLVVLAGCDTRELLTLGNPRVPAPRQAVEQPIALGGTFIPSPPNSGAGSSADMTVALVPDSTWVVVQTSGAINLTYNPACGSRPPNYPCPLRSPTGAFSSAPLPWGPVAVWAWSGSSGGWMKMRGTGGDGNNPGLAIGLTYIEQAGGIAARISVPDPVTTWDPLFGTAVPSWNMSGGYSVTATAVPSPFRVTESVPDADGVVTYTAEALYGLQFINPLEFGAWGWPAGALYWRFFPGESLPDKPDHSWPGWTIYECEHKLVCRWQPPVPGRMQVGAYVETRLAYARSKPATVQEQLTLTCTGDRGRDSVTRGDEIRCTVTAPSSAGPLAVTGWSFDDEPRQDEPLTEATWSGPMVKAGVIMVRARVGTGQEQSAKATITVLARDWSSKSPDVTAQRVPNGSQRTAPRLPEEVIWTHDLGKTRFWPEMELTEIIDRGPNRDYYYFEDVRFKVVGYYSLNDEAFASGSAFQRAQEPNKSGSGSSTTIGGMNYCQQRDVPRQAPRVETHEKEHVRVFGERYTQIVRPEYERLEAMASKNEEELTRVTDTLWETASRDAQKHSRAVVDDPNGRYVTRFVDANGQQCTLKNVRGADLTNDPNRQ